MNKVVFISGSPRKGNTEFVLKRLFLQNGDFKEIVLLREKNIQRCEGCLNCLNSGKCYKKDDMGQLILEIIKADLIVLGTPNYFDNVPGILKDFIDRTSPLLNNKKLKGKRLLVITVGGGRIKNSKRVVKGALRYFSEIHKINLSGYFCLKALNKNDLSETKNIEKIIEIINKKIRF